LFIGSQGRLVGVWYARRFNVWSWGLVKGSTPNQEAFPKEISVGLLAHFFDSAFVGS